MTQPRATGRLAHIFRYPIKSVGREALDDVALTPGHTLPGDRRFAVLHRDAVQHLAGGELNKWLPKSAFLRGAAAAPLQAIRGGWDGDVLVLDHPDLPTLRVDPARDEAALLDWLRPLWADSGKAPPARLVEGPQPLTDSSAPYVSVLSLSSLAAVEDRLGRKLGTDRWRGNLWIDGWPPFAELEASQADLRIGDVQLRVCCPIGRCPATSADTETGVLDGDTPRELQAAYGHDNFGIYAEVCSPGTIRAGNAAVMA